MRVVEVNEQRRLDDKERSSELLDICEATVDQVIEQIQEQYGSDAVVTRGNMRREVVEPFLGEPYVEAACSIQVTDVVVIERPA